MNIYYISVEKTICEHRTKVYDTEMKQVEIAYRKRSGMHNLKTVKLYYGTDKWLTGKILQRKCRGK